MAKFKDLFPGRYLKVDDLRGGDLTLTIESFDQEMISGRLKPVVTFDTGDKLVMNATNGRILFHLLADDTEGWIGHTITLYKGVAKFQGEDVDSVMVSTILPKKDPSPALPATTPEDDPEDDPKDIPF